MPKSLSYPAEMDCVMLELPVRGTWLAKHAGASGITNGHHRNHPYAIDILKLGPDGRPNRGREEGVTDFYSYDEPIYAPADGRVVQVVDSVEGTLIGNHIIIDIGNEKYVFFAHLKNGSIAVEEDQFVKAGTRIGRVGNSGGASGILHLHMHVQNKATWDRGGKVTYPFRFRKMLRKRLFFWREVSNGFLLRNDKFSD
jgi:murein DD-endopeptidase MepM/ murein hydrolase activator NlpD